MEVSVQLSYSMEFSGKIVLVTGAASGIGLATSKQFQSLGAFVILVDKDPVNLELAEKEFDRSRSLCLMIDLTEKSGVEKLTEEIQVRHGKLDVLVNNAGILSRDSVENAPLDTLESLFKINCHALVHLTSSCVPLLKAANGCVVNVSSLSSTVSCRGFFGYAMTKASVDSFTRSAAIDLARYGIRVNSVNPGAIDTPIWSKSGMSEDSAERFAKRTPLGKGGCPEDVSEAICFLASRRASYITGIHVVVDGGFSLIN